jgi:hypothetical protein
MSISFCPGSENGYTGLNSKLFHSRKELEPFGTAISLVSSGIDKREKSFMLSQDLILYGF